MRGCQFPSCGCVCRGNHIVDAVTLCEAAEPKHRWLGVEAVKFVSGSGLSYWWSSVGVRTNSMIAGLSLFGATILCQILIGIQREGDL